MRLSENLCARVRGDLIQGRAALAIAADRVDGIVELLPGRIQPTRRLNKGNTAMAHLASPSAGSVRYYQLVPGTVLLHLGAKVSCAPHQGRRNQWQLILDRGSKEGPRRRRRQRRQNQGRCVAEIAARFADLVHAISQRRHDRQPVGNPGIVRTGGEAEPVEARERVKGGCDWAGRECLDKFSQRREHVIWVGDPIAKVQPMPPRRIGFERLGVTFELDASYIVRESTHR